jgi:hypothetical protein
MSAYELDERNELWVGRRTFFRTFSFISYPSSGHKGVGGDELSGFLRGRHQSSLTEVSPEECDERSGG